MTLRLPVSTLLLIASAVSSGQSQAGTRLVYNLSTSREIDLSIWRGRDGSSTSAGESVVVVLRPGTVEIAAPGRQQVILDFRARRRTWIDHVRRLYTTTSWEPTPSKKRIAPAAVARTTSRLVAGRRIHLRIYELRLPDGKRLECAVSNDFSVPREALNFWWTALLKESGLSPTIEGVPVSIAVRKADTVLGVVSLVAVESRGLPPAFNGESSGYRRVTQNSRARVREDALRHRGAFDEYRRALEAPPNASRRVQSVPSRASTLRTSYAPDQKIDYAWAYRQTFLDQLTGIVNGASKAFENFKGDADGGEMHLQFNWWNQLEPALTFDEKPAVVAFLKKAWVAYRINAYRDQGELVGFTPAERDQFRQMLFDVERGWSERSDWDAEINKCLSQFESKAGCRIVLTLGFDPPDLARQLGYQPVRSIFPAATVDRLVSSEFDFIAAPDIALGLTEHSGDWQDVVHYRLWDFDVEVSTDHKPLLANLSIYSGGISFELVLKQLYIDFQYATTPAETWQSAVCNGFTLGGCALAQTNYGTGYANADDIRIKVNLVFRRAGDGTIILSPTVASDESQLDFSAALLGFNLGQDVLTGIVGVVVSLFDVPNSKILDGLDDALDSALAKAPVDWLANWNANDGPQAIQRVPNASRQSSVFRILVDGFTPDLSREGVYVAPPTNPTVIDPALFTNSGGFGFSADYLADWVNNILGHIPETRVRPPLSAQDLGITYPDVTALPRPNVAAEPNSEARERRFEAMYSALAQMFSTAHPPVAVGCSTPASEGPRRQIRTRFVRRRPEVVLPPPGQNVYAGRVRVVTRLIVEAVEVRGEPTVGMVKPWSCHVRGVRGDMAASGSPPRSVNPLWQYRPNPRDAVPRSVPESVSRTTPTGFEPPQQWVPPELPDFGFEQVPSAGLACEPARCTWVSVEKETVLRTFLDAELVVEQNLLLGFDCCGDVWLPALNIRAATNIAQMTATVSSVSVQPPFDGIPRATLEQVMKNAAIAEIFELLDPLTKRDVYVYRGLAPAVIDLPGMAPAELQGFVTIHQTPAAGQSFTTTDQLVYTVRGNLLHWPVSVSEHLTQHLPH